VLCHLLTLEPNLLHHFVFPFLVNYVFFYWYHANNNLLLAEREGRTEEYWPEVVAVWTERSEVRAKTIEGHYSPVRLGLARLVSSLLYGTRAMLLLNLPAFESKKYAAYDRFHGNGPYGKILTKKGPIRTLGFAPPNNNHMVFTYYYCILDF